MVSLNPNITWDIIAANPEYQWDWKYISQNPNITMDIITPNKNIAWDYTYMSDNPNLTLEFINNNLQKSWDWHRISMNLSIVTQFIAFEIFQSLILIDLKYHQQISRFNCYNLLKQGVLNEIIKKNLNKIRNANCIWPSQIQIVNYYFNINWACVSESKYLTIEMVQAFPNNPWNFYWMSALNPNITWSIIAANRDLPLELQAFIIRNHNSKLDMITSETIYEASFNHSHMTYEFVKKHNLEFYAVSANPNITWETIHSNNISEWNINKLSQNKFTKSEWKLYEN
jgi:hypothetical protein